MLQQGEENKKDLRTLELELEARSLRQENKLKDFTLQQNLRLMEFERKLRA